MDWARVIEELERQAAFADGMSAKNTIDPSITRAFAERTDMLLAISVRLRAMTTEEDYNGFWTKTGEWATAPSTGSTDRGSTGLCPEIEEDSGGGSESSAKRNRS